MLYCHVFYCNLQYIIYVYSNLNRIHFPPVTATTPLIDISLILHIYFLETSICLFYENFQKTFVTVCNFVSTFKSRLGQQGGSVGCNFQSIYDALSSTTVGC